MDRTIACDDVVYMGGARHFIVTGVQDGYVYGAMPYYDSNRMLGEVDEFYWSEQNNFWVWCP